MARPEHRLAALQAYADGVLGVSWWPTTRSWAEKQGWKLPLFGWKKVFIRYMLKTDETFERALIESSIDVYIPTKYFS